MTSIPDSELQSIDRTTLTPLVRRALGSETAEVTSWDARQIYGGGGYDSAGKSTIYRFAGYGRDQADTVEWSLILKALLPPLDRGQPSDFDYWRREADAFESGLLEDLPGSLATPRCFCVVDQPDGECWIWMEDVQDDFGSQWPLEYYGVAARHLGQFNGAYLAGRAIPSWLWLRRRSWLRDKAIRADLAIGKLLKSRTHPLVRRAYPPDYVDRLLCKQAEQDRFLDAIDHLPQTLCHGDAFRRNLFARRTLDGLEHTVAIDWALMYVGWIGRDIRALVDSTLIWRDVDQGEAKELDHIVFEGYLDGLHDSGWKGDPRQVRLGQIADSCVVAFNGQLLEVFLDESRHAWAEKTFGMSITEGADYLAEQRRHSPFDREKEARELLGLA